MHALCLPLGASISLLIMFFFFDSMQLLFAVCTASECDSVYLKTLLNLFPLIFCSYCNGGIGLSLAAHVPVHHTSLHGRQTFLIWHLWTIYGSGAIQFHALRLHCVRLGTHRTLASNGWLVQIAWLILINWLPWVSFCSHGNGLVCGLYCVRAPAQSEGVNAAFDRAADLRRLLGVPLIVHIQHKCDGQGGHPTRR